MKMNKAIWGPSLLVLAIAVVTSSTVQAASYSMTGKWNESRGTIDLPLGAVLGAPGPPVPAAGTVTQTGAPVVGGGPATIGIPPNVFVDPAALRGFQIPVPGFLQLTTSIAHAGPSVSTTFMAGGGPGSFAYCPGAAANPACTSVAAGGMQGIVNGIVQYSAGPNTFGGTFKMLLSGTGKLTSKGSALPSTAMTSAGTVPALPFSAINVAIGGSGLAILGLPFSGMQTLVFGALPRTHPLGYMTTPMGLLTPGPTVMAGVASSQTATGFPFTTGTVYVYRSIANQSGAGVPTKHTLTGYDNRTAGGNGRIQLVSGAMSRTFPTDGSNPPEGSAMGRGTINMTFVRQPALPLSSPAALATLGSLIMLSAGYAVTAKRARK